MEAAVIVYGSLMNKDSFPLVLSCFPDPADRENVCHRLGIRIDDTGRVVATTRAAAAAAAAR